jgi:hypothetical protein
MFGVKMVIVPDSHLPKEHYASSLYIAIAHPFWFWLYRKLSWNVHTLYQVVPGYSRPLYRTKGAYWMNGVLYCTKRQSEEIRRGLRAKDLTAAVNRPSDRGLYRGLFG